MAAAKIPHFAVYPAGIHRLELRKQRREDEYCDDATPECGISTHKLKSNKLVDNQATWQH